MERGADHRMEVLGVGGRRTTALVHDELTDPVDRALAHEDVRGGDLDLGEAGEDLDRGQGDVHVNLPGGHQTVTDE